MAGVFLFVRVFVCGCVYLFFVGSATRFVKSLEYDLTFLWIAINLSYQVKGLIEKERKGDTKMSAVLTTKDIVTVVAKVVDINTGETIEPIYEAYGYEKFQEFVDFYRKQNYINKIVWVRGFGYNDENGASRVLATEFVGVGSFE